MSGTAVRIVHLAFSGTSPVSDWSAPQGCYSSAFFSGFFDGVRMEPEDAESLAGWTTPAYAGECHVEAYRLGYAAGVERATTRGYLPHYVVEYGTVCEVGGRSGGGARRLGGPLLAPWAEFGADGVYATAEARAQLLPSTEHAPYCARATGDEDATCVCGLSSRNEHGA